MTTTFKLSNGASYSCTFPGHDGKYLAILVQRQLDDGTFLLEMSDAVAALPDPKVEKIVSVLSEDRSKLLQATDTCLLAVNEDYKEYSDVSEYNGDSFSSNCSYFHKIEVIARFETAMKRVLLSWEGNLCMMDYIEDLEEKLIEQLENDDLEVQGLKLTDPGIVSRYSEMKVTLYDNEGEVFDADISIYDFVKAVTSIRLIEFQEIIND